MQRILLAIFSLITLAGTALAQVDSVSLLVTTNGVVIAPQTFFASNGIPTVGLITNGQAAVTFGTLATGTLQATNLVTTHTVGLYLSDQSGVSVLVAAPPAVTLPYVLRLPSDIQVTNTGYVKFTVTNILGTNYLSLYLSPQ